MSTPSKVCLVAANDLRADHHWEASAGDLAQRVAGPLLDGPFGAFVDSVFVAAPVIDQSALGAVLVDRLGLSGNTAVYQAEAGDGAGGAALHAAVAHIAAGFSRCALLLGVAKVADLQERERGTLLDGLLDREIESPLGLTFQSQSGVLADLYLAKHGLKAGSLAHIVAKNAANAFLGGETFLPHAPMAQEIMRDLPVAPPLVRSDFPPILDGATAVILCTEDLAREIGVTPVYVESIAGASDIAVLADRPEPLLFRAPKMAATRALERAKATLDECVYVDIATSTTIAEILTLESIGMTEPGKTGASCKDGFGRINHARVVNPGGAAQGRGLALGTCGVVQAREAFLQLGAGAGKRQVKAASTNGAKALAISLVGLGNAAYASVFSRGAT